VILHKLTEDLDAPKPRSVKLDGLEAYLADHPGTVVVDPVESVRNVVNRQRTCLCLQAIQRRLLQACPFGQPAFAVIEPPVFAPEVVDNEAVMRAHGLVFPVICKPVKACGTPISHSMMIVLSPEGFAEVKAPFIVQQFHDHNAFFYKVYVLDGEVMASRRRSLPNFQEMSAALLDAGLCCIPFDSRNPFPTIYDLGMLCSAPESKQGGLSSDADIDTHSGVDLERRVPSAEVFSRLQRTATDISQEFGLTLFGFDVIVPTNTSDCGGDLLVIDVNFFPSYKDVPDFPTKLRAYLRRVAELEPWRKKEDHA
jgi:hypothetical protein